MTARTIRDRQPLAVIPTFRTDTEVLRYVVALESDTSGYVVTEVNSLDDTEWTANGWYYDTPLNAVRAAAFRSLYGPASWDMVRAMSAKGCVSR